MQNFIPIAQAITAVLLIVFILLQQRGTAMGSALGGQGGGGTYSTKRGLQEKIVWITYFLGTVFVILALISLFAQ